MRRDLYRSTLGRLTSLQARAPWLEHVLVAAFFLLLTAIITWPLVLYLDKGINFFGDSLLQLMTLSWDAHALTTNPLGIYDAPFFYPYLDSLAFSDHLIGQTLLTLPAQLLSGNPALAANLYRFFSYAATGYGTYLLARDVTGSRVGALAAGTAFAFTGYRFMHFDHLNLLSTEWMPLTLWALRRGLICNSGRWIALAVLFFSTASLSAVYHTFFLMVAIGAYLAWWVYRWWRYVRKSEGKTAFGASRTLKLLLAGAAAAVVAGLSFLPYAQVNAELGASRSPQEVQNWAASWSYYLQVPSTNLFWGAVRPQMLSSLGERELFPGAVVLLLAVAGLFLGRRRQPEKEGEAGGHPQTLGRGDPLHSPEPQGVDAGGHSQTPGQGSAPVNPRARGEGKSGGHPQTPGSGEAPHPRSTYSSQAERWWWLALGLLALVMTFGLSYPLPGGGEIPLPYAILYNWVPGFGGLRVPVRFVALLDLSLAVLAAYGLAALVDRLRSPSGQVPSGSRLALAAAATVLLVSGIYVESLQSLNLSNRADARPPSPQPYTWLASQPPGPVIEFPFGDFGQDIRHAYWETYNWHPLVNGYSGFIPPGTVSLSRALQSFPDASGVALLQALEVRYVVFHLDSYGEEDRAVLLQKLKNTPLLSPAYQAGQSYVYTLAADPWLRDLSQGRGSSPGRVWFTNDPGPEGDIRHPEAEVLAYFARYRLGWQGVYGDLKLGYRRLPALPPGVPADYIIQPGGSPPSDGYRPQEDKSYATIYRRDPSLLERYDFSTTRTSAGDSLAIGTQEVSFGSDAPQTRLTFAAFMSSTVTLQWIEGGTGSVSINLPPGVSSYTGPVAPRGGKVTLSSASSAGTATILSAERWATSPGPPGLSPQSGLLLEVAAGDAQPNGDIAARARLVPDYPGQDHLTMTMDVYKTPGGTHPEGHYGAYSVAVPVSAEGRTYELVLHTAQKSVTGTLNGQPLQVFAWEGPPTEGDFRASLSLWAGDRKILSTPLYNMTLRGGHPTDVSPYATRLLQLPGAASP